MLDVFKKTLTRHWLPGHYISPAGHPCCAGAPGAIWVERHRVPAGTPGAVVEKEKTTKYYGRVPGQREPVPLCANKDAARTMLLGLLGKSALKGAGLNDPHDEHRRRPLVEHLDDFRSAMEGKGNDRATRRG